jgi:L-threonylcarbamoyladenylate synthase
MQSVAVVEATAAGIEKAAGLLRAGRLVAFPTETVYGLGADATNGAAVAAIFAAKGRPRFNPLIAHVADAGAVARYADLGVVAAKLAAALWPGPLTLVLPRRADSGISDLVTAGLDTVAMRVPSHPIARELLRRAGVPVAAPSANRSGHVSPTTAAHVDADLGGQVAMILDGGPTRHGLESTVVAVDAGGATILRPGAITAEQIEAILSAPVARAFDGGNRPQSPGQLESHYAPRARVRLDATSVAAGEALLAFGPSAPATAGPAINLSPDGDLVEAACNLFAALRALDQPGVLSIAVMPIPAHGLGEAINDRLRRAAKG